MMLTSSVMSHADWLNRKHDSAKRFQFCAEENGQPAPLIADQNRVFLF